MPTTEYDATSRAVAFARTQPWLIEADSLSASLHRFGMDLEARVSGNLTDAPQAAAERTNTVRAGAVAVIPVYNVLLQRADWIAELFGMTSIERLSAAFSQAVADPSVGSIVLRIDSPGGGVYGVAEMADQILKARGKKPIVAVADSMAASAAYWIASAADEIVVTTGGQVGSIGVYTIHEDASRWVDAQGITVSLISAGKYKTEGSPFEPLGEEARAAMQARVNDYYSLFTRAVAKGRGVSVDDVRGGFGEGRVVGAQQAVKLGMADRVDTYDATVARLARGGARPSGQRADSEDIDLRRRRTRLLSH